MADRFGAADVVMGSVRRFARNVGRAVNLGNVSDYVARLDAWPARLRALAVT